jgi:hypothetical protein
LLDEINILAGHESNRWILVIVIVVLFKCIRDDSSLAFAGLVTSVFLDTVKTEDANSTNNTDDGDDDKEFDKSKGG